MINESEITRIVDLKLSGTSIFLVNIKVLAGNRIFVFIDGDEGVSIEDCIMLSKHIESSLNREVEDYSLEVSSSGLTSPLVLLRQYKKFLGKGIEISTIDGTKIKGSLINYSEDKIEIKLIHDKKKLTKNNLEEENKVIPFNIIKEVKPVITFK